MTLWDSLRRYRNIRFSGGILARTMDILIYLLHVLLGKSYKLSPRFIGETDKVTQVSEKRLKKFSRSVTSCRGPKY